MRKAASKTSNGACRKNINIIFTNKPILKNKINKYEGEKLLYELKWNFENNIF